MTRQHLQFVHRNAFVREPRQRLVPQIVPVQVDLPKIVPFQPPLAAIDQFRIQNAVIGADYGRNAGAAIDIVTRSGTNTLSGGVFEFIRDSALDARNYLCIYVYMSMNV